MLMLSDTLAANWQQISSIQSWPSSLEVDACWCAERLLKAASTEQGGRPAATQPPHSNLMSNNTGA